MSWLLFVDYGDEQTELVLHDIELVKKGINVAKEQEAAYICVKEIEVKGMKYKYNKKYYEEFSMLEE